MKFKLISKIIGTFSLVVVVSASCSHETKETVWVEKEDGSVQCEANRSRDLDADKKALEKSGVKVVNAKKSEDGMMRIQLCGTPTGAQNAFEIDKEDLNKATSAGFKKKQVGAE